MLDHKRITTLHSRRSHAWPIGAWRALLCAGLALAACGEDDAPAADTKIDVMLTVLLDRGPGEVGHGMPTKLMRVRPGTFEGQDDLFVDVLIEANPSALTKLGDLGATVRTVTSSGIMTAQVPLSRVRTIAALDEVTRIEAARSVRLYNDLSNGLLTTPEGLRVGMDNEGRTHTGAGVVVGIIDTGIDWTHRDFILDASEGTPTPHTRVRYYWDQSDRGDDRPPAGFTIGHEYSAADLDDALANYDNTWDPLTNTFGPLADGYPIAASARDLDGHGTHVAGTAAGDGSGSGRMGVAPDADIIMVKFDFDGDRNTDANIVDGINYIFQRAAELGKPAVVNMSLGSDYGPHDGSTLEERGIDDLAGPGRVVVVAAGNPGAANWSPQLRWGYALHGQGTLPAESFTFRFPTYDAAADDDYVFFDVWYPGGNKCRVRVTTPAGVTYPPSNAKRTWITGSSYTGYNTPEGAILVQNGNDPIGFGSDGADIDAYIEVSDYWGTPPAVGTWTFELVPADSRSTCAGTYHAWYGASESVIAGLRGEPTRDPTPRFAGRESDNRITIGNPASADEVIAAAAYMSRDAWAYAYGIQDGGMCLADSTPAEQAYNEGLLAYYDPFALGELANFSARGPRRDGVLKPEVATPGVGIASTFSHFTRHDEWEDRCTSYWDGGPYHYGTNRVLPGDEAAILQGTSMAAPNATGAVAALLEAKGDLDDACIRQVLADTAAHDPATDVFEEAPFTAHTDTDPAAAAGQPNADWGHGKMDIAAALTYLGAYPECGDGCVDDAQCGAGFKCDPPADPCACGTCESCKPAKAACTTGDECCSGVCSGKRNKSCQ